MALKKALGAPPPSLSEDEDVIELSSHPCRFPQHEMRTPRARPRSPSEPRTPSKGPAGKPFTLGSPLVTPKLDRRKTKYRAAAPAAATPAAATAAATAATDAPTAAPVNPSKYRSPERFAAPGFTEKELKDTPDAVVKGNPRLKWCPAEADETEQLLRRFDMEAMVS